MPAKISKAKNAPKPGKVFGSHGVFYSFPEGEGGPIQIRIDFGLVPAPLSYYYADSLLLSLEEEHRMALLSFGRRDENTNKFADRIDIAMPMKSLFGQFWASSTAVQDTLDKVLKSMGTTPKIRPIPSAESQAQTFFANMIFLAVGEGESTLDFHHLSPREVHLAKTQKKDMQVQPTIRVIMSSALTKYFFDTLRPHAEEGTAFQPIVGRSRRAAQSH